MPQRVLFVEDEPDILGLLVFHLEREGYQVTQSRTGPEGLRLAVASPPDLVLLDLTLAGDDGTVVLRRLRHSHPEVPVVIISMHPVEQFGRRVLQAGAAGYVSGS